MDQRPSSLKYAAFLLLPLQILAYATSSDKLALLSFKLALSDDPLGALAPWNDSAPFCRWRGVACGVRHPERVTALDLESLGLTGPLPPSLANLTFLRRLHLPGNGLYGQIPGSLGGLSRLEYLNLSRNALEGALPPALLNCSALRTVSLRGNILQGDIPASLPPLAVLDLSNNMFTGAIPHSIGNISALTYLDLSNNSLSGSIPPSVGTLPSVAFFDLSRNSLSGDVPASIWNLSTVTRLELHTNNLTGTLPADLGSRLPQLVSLLLYENQFTGPIPASISNASGLQSIQLYYNELSGTIPRSIGSLQNLRSLILGDNQLEADGVGDWGFFTGLVNSTNLQILDVSNNLLGGVLPGAIANLSTGLTWLGMMGNHFSGSIPPEISNLVGLSQFRINQNRLTGQIPASIGKLQNLIELHLYGNSFSGEIPAEIGNLTQLSLLYLERNHFTGAIPRTLGNCKNLQLLNLGYNQLTGTIPLEIMSIYSLSIYLSFSHNSLTGQLPSEIGGLTSLDAVDVSDNHLSGEIPSALGNCLSMEFIFMEGNLFNGSIPASLGQLKGLQLLDLSRNNLSGQIPEFLAGFPYLDTLNLSFNSFEGAVPKDGRFGNLSVVSIQGNNNLCGGNPGLHLPPCPVQAPQGKHNSSRLKEIIAVVGAVLSFLVLVCSLIACYYVVKSRRSARGRTTKNPHQIITYNDLVKATDGFSEANLIGRGSFGSVYKATIRYEEADQVVAVKVIDQKQRGASKSFTAECEALRNVRHRNLVKILTVCSSVDSTGNAFAALIFEFMPNGSLEKWLHPGDQEGPGSRTLSLVQRLDIAVDVANALDYLHRDGEAPIVHCDLKPSNVLLDDGMVARVGDFGLARIIDRTARDTSQVSTSSSGLKGTIGYVAPEYGMANKVSTQGDVYSYGILLLEMFTGKTPTDHVFRAGLSLRKFVEMAVTGRFIEAVDASMFQDEDDEGDRVHECLATVLRIGLSCTEELPGERMHMGDVTKELMAAKDAFLQKRTTGEMRCKALGGV